MTAKRLPSPLKLDNDQVTANGQSYPIVNGVIRFVEDDHYASSFGLQWNTYYKTQLDSYTGTTISRDRLTRLAGGSLDVFNGKDVLEVGCGAGRFSEIMLSAGANLVSIDLSHAVDACYANNGTSENIVIAQGNILDLPLDPQQFDVVICVGVVQHTPNPEETMSTLCSYVKPGGLLIIDHYTHGYPTTWSRRVLRRFLLHRSASFSLRFVQVLTNMLWPIHRGLKRLILTRFHRIALPLYRAWFKFSPLVDYQDAYPQLGPVLMKEWATLDTHDTLTDTYKHIRSADEIESHLRSCGMVNIETEYAGNGVEARARKAEE